MQSSLIKSLELCWDTIEVNYGYALSILKMLGYEREFNNAPEYSKLWAIVNTGKLINKDVTEWEHKLAKETKRLKVNHEECEKFIKENEAERKRLDKIIAENNAYLASLEKELAILEAQSK